MVWLHIMYDPTGMVLACDPNSGIRIATLPLAKNLSDVDVYRVARELAEKLLEQMSAASG